jgi:peptidoglycan glycosyltransferase
LQRLAPPARGFAIVLLCHPPPATRGRPGPSSKLMQSIPPDFREQLAMTRAYVYRRHRLAARRSRAHGGKTLSIFIIVPLVAATIMSCMGAVATVLSFYAGIEANADPPQEKIDARGGGARIYDRNGVLLYEYLDEDYGFQTRVKLDDISPLIRDATIASEDASFYSNPGVNVRGLVRAGVENLRPGDDFFQGSGGSSITQQLV